LKSALADINLSYASCGSTDIAQPSLEAASQTSTVIDKAQPNNRRLLGEGRGKWHRISSP
jgi:hypothetical protein